MNGGFVPGTNDPVLLPIEFSVDVENFTDENSDVNLDVTPHA